MSNGLEIATAINITIEQIYMGRRINRVFDTGGIDAKDRIALTLDHLGIAFFTIHFHSVFCF